MDAELLILEAPRWPKQAERRLRMSLLLSTVCIATIVMVLRFPVVEQTAPFAELLVQIIVGEVEAMVLPPDTVIAGEAIADGEAPLPPPRIESDNVDAIESPDWLAMMPDAAQAALDNAPRKYSINPVLDEKRRRAAVKFAPRQFAPPTPIWENVAKDALGRAVLWSGDCYRVVDDPNAGSREAFETFGQYIVMCMNWKDRPQELPWVNEIRNRRASLARYAPPAAE